MRSFSDEELLDAVADALLVLSSVGIGDYSVRVRSELEKGHPLAELFAGLNEMISSLESERKQSLQYQAELEEKLATIEQQRAAIRELSTPIMEVWDGVLCLPVVGVMDTMRSSEMTSELLQAVVEKQTQCAIVDITGIEAMDTSTAQHFIRMAKAVRLLGAQCVLTGINPTIAQTVVHMGIDLSDIMTHRSLRDALQHYVDRRDDKGREGGRG